MKNRKVKTIIALTALTGVLTVGGISAYFTDADEASNTFTVGKISIDLQEPNWNPDDGKDLTPSEEIKKDPQIKNDGVNDAFVFAEVTVPYANVTIANADGTKKEAADTELFSYTINNGWVEVGTAKKDTTNKTITHLYAYATDDAMTALAKDATTPAVFDKVIFANIVEDEGLETTTQKIDVKGYAIQTQNVNGGKTAPADVWEVIKNQAPSTEKGAEDPKTDIKQ